MPSVHLSSCSFAHAVGLPVLRDVDLDLGPGWVGVVGPNGAGKSTLLQLVAGVLTPTTGSCHLVAAVPPVVVPQEVHEVDDDLRAFAWDWDDDAPRLRSRLGLDPEDLERWDTLSPGERKRWQLGAALSRRPDVLLLDEPTNHLDVDARSLLVDALGGFDGVGLVVSHDRALLEALTTRTLRVRGGRVDLHEGAYGEARVAWTATEAAARDAHDRARREERRLRRVLAEVRHDRSGAEHAGRAARRASPKEPDAREAGRKFAQRKAEQKLANRVHQLNRRVARAEDAVADATVARALGGPLHLDAGRGARRWVVRLQGDLAHAGGGTVLSGVDLGVRRGEHVHVAGPNGAGKTTLLQALVAAAPGEVGWLPQELAPVDAIDVLDRVRSLDPDQRGRVLGVVATLGVDPDRVLVSDRPSPGEARKLALSLLLLGATDLVVLDEPTNHLDLPAIERLEEAVATYDGALVLATHDTAFAAATTQLTWHADAGRVAAEASSR